MKENGRLVNRIRRQIIQRCSKVWLIAQQESVEQWRFAWTILAQKSAMTPETQNFSNLSI